MLDDVKYQVAFYIDEAIYGIVENFSFVQSILRLFRYVLKEIAVFGIVANAGVKNRQ